ncbi:MAG: STAS domain-containing protein [Chitinophagales bacterium]
MKFALDKKDSYTVFSLLESKLNTLVAPDLKTELTILHNEGIRNIILDLEKVSFVDSSGLSAILVGNRLCSRSGGSLIVAAIADNVNRLFKISQLDSVLTIIASVQQARDYVMMQELVNELQDEEIADEGDAED